MKIRFKYSLLVCSLLPFISSIASCQTYKCPISQSERSKLEKKIEYKVKTQCQVIAATTSVSKDSVQVYGSIFDRISGEPLAALIQITEIKIGATADDKGQFKLLIPKGAYKLEVVNPGSFTFVTKQIQFESDTQVNVCLGTSVIK